VLDCVHRNPYAGGGTYVNSKKQPRSFSKFMKFCLNTLDMPNMVVSTSLKISTRDIFSYLIFSYL